MSSLSKKQSLASRSQRFRKKRQEGSKLTRDTTHRKNTRCWRGESLLVRVGEPWWRSDERLNWVLEKEYYILKGSWDGGRVSEDQRCWGTAWPCDLTVGGGGLGRSNKPEPRGLLSVTNRHHQLQGASFLPHQWPEIWLTQEQQSEKEGKRERRQNPLYSLNPFPHHSVSVYCGVSGYRKP